MTVNKPVTARKKPVEVQTIQWTGDNHRCGGTLTAVQGAVLTTEPVKCEACRG